MVWEFTGDDSQMAFSNLTINFIQPLLRGAFRDVRMEPLTQSERNVLYAVRDFARFRKIFYFNTVSGDAGYLSLLLQLQAIRNLESNVESLRSNLLAHEALAEAGIVSPLQVDQVFQQYQNGRLRLIRAQNNYETSLDQYKIRLGLPPELEIELDDSLLAPFELNSPEITSLEESLEALLAEFRALDAAPPLERLQEGMQELASLNAALLEQWETVSAELQRWQEQPIEVEDLEQRERQTQLRTTLGQRMEELQRDMQETQRDVQRASDALAGQPLEAGWESVQQMARRLSAHAADLFVIQTQVRAYLIELPEIDMEREDAVFYALDNRLDLKNSQAQVVDSWRRIRVAADALQADLDVFLQADIATAPDANTPFDFSARASRYRVGVEFDAPLNRLAERNIYRGQLIQYQRSRRDYIGVRDTVVRSVRLDLRQLAADRLNFEIARQSLITAARQVELARVQLLAPAPEAGPGGKGSDSSHTQDVLNALNSLLDAQNNLVAIWIAYERGRLQLLVDTEAMQLDARGMPYEYECDGDESDHPDGTAEPESIDTPPPSADAGGDGAAGVPFLE
jgi:outer membrane protein TolC